MESTGRLYRGAHEAIAMAQACASPEVREALLAAIRENRRPSVLVAPVDPRPVLPEVAPPAVAGPIEISSPS